MFIFLAVNDFVNAFLICALVASSSTSNSELLDNVFDEIDYKDNKGYKVRRVENISAQLIEDVQESITEGLDI